MVLLISLGAYVIGFYILWEVGKAVWKFFSSPQNSTENKDPNETHNDFNDIT